MEIRDVKGLVKRFSKEIIIALILAIISAIAFEYIKDKIHEKRIRNNLNAVATIVTYDEKGKILAQGSGFFIKPDGTLVTNYHVINGSHLPFTVAKLPTGAYYKLKGIKGINKNYDVAVLQFEARETPFVKQGDSDEINPGQKVIAIGVPLGLESTISEGVISHTKRAIDGREFIQFTASISSGSSGGGLFLEDGKTIGITTLTIREPAKETNAQNLNFAVPINIVKNVLSGKEKAFTEKSPEYFYSMGVIASNQKNYDEATKYFLKAIELDKNYADAYIDLGAALSQKGLYEDELKVLKIAVQLAPKNSDAFYYLAQAYEDLGEYSNAITAYKKLLEFDPDNKDAIYSLGIDYLASGDKSKALELIPKLSKVNPGLGNLLKTLANRTR